MDQEEPVRTVSSGSMLLAIRPYKYYRNLKRTAWIPMRLRGWAGSSGSMLVKNALEKFKQEPEWKVNPTITPKGQSYYEHDNRSRDDMTFWERKQMFLKTGRYPARGFRGGRGGITRGRGRGRGGLDQGFFKRTLGAAMDEWKHDKFDEVATEENESPTKDNKDVKDTKTDKKSDRKDRRDSKDVKKDKDDRRARKDRESSSKKEKDSSSKKSVESSNKKTKEIEKDPETIRKEEESLQQELKVEVTIG